MGTISLKDLVSIPLLKLNILLHIYNRKLCARPNAWTFWHEQVPCPSPQFKPQRTRRCDRRMFTLIHLSTFSGCLWLKKRDYYVHNGRIGLFILSWSTITGYSVSILSQLAKHWLVSDSSFFDSWHNISADIQWQWITTRWITLHKQALHKFILLQGQNRYNDTMLKSHYPTGNHHASHLFLSPGHDHLLTTSTDDPSSAGAWAIIKVLGHQHQCLASGYDLKIGLSRGG